MGEMVPCMHTDDRRKIRENYICAYSLARLMTADLAPIMLPNLWKRGRWIWAKALHIITRC